MPTRILRPQVFKEQYGIDDALLRHHYGHDCVIIDVERLPHQDEELKELVLKGHIDVLVAVANNGRLAYELGIETIGPAVSFNG